MSHSDSDVVIFFEPAMFIHFESTIVDEGFQLATFVQWRVLWKSDSNPVKFIKIINNQAMKETC